MSRILYFSQHEVLEFDDLRVLTSLGHRVFSTGTFGKPHDGALRKGLPGFFDDESHRAFAGGGGGAIQNGVLHLSRAFVDRFDLVIVNHDPHFLIANTDALVGKPVIFRTLGQSLRITERMITPYRDGLWIVRYSPNEDAIPRFLKSDAMVRFAKLAADFLPRKPRDKVATFFNNLPRRPDATPSSQSYTGIVHGLDAALYGLGNEGVPTWKGAATSQADIYASCRAYLYIHSAMASYTLNLIEAMMAGCPIITPSLAYLNSRLASDPNWHPARWEVESILSGHGLIFDTDEQARDLVADIALGRMDVEARSNAIRSKAESLFGFEQVAADWRRLIERVLVGDRLFRSSTIGSRVRASLLGRSWRI